MSNLRLGVYGAGFVGSSVINGFDTDTVDIHIVDPKHNSHTTKSLLKLDPHLVFICVPTPESKTGEVDTSIVNSVLKELENNKYTGIVVIKSTITADYLIQFKKQYKLRLVYNPEFLTEANAHQDFINPQMQILGGRWKDCELVEKAYVKHSRVKIVPTFKTDMISASLLKYTINSWLATKVTFMNEIQQLHESSGANTSWEQFTDMLQRDTRIGNTHLKVPGPDGKFGFGGHCFPKDTAALLAYAEKLDVDLSVLEQAVKTNVKHRKKKV